MSIHPPTAAATVDFCEDPATLRSMDLVAYRGLWDRFAAADSLEAIIRSYKKNIPSVIRHQHLQDLEAILAFSAQLPIFYYAISARAPVPCLQAISIIAVTTPKQPWLISGTQTGVYYPTTAPTQPIPSLEPAYVLYESEDVLDVPSKQKTPPTRSDAQTLEQLKNIYGAHRTYLRVSDLPEAHIFKHYMKL